MSFEVFDVICAETPSCASEVSTEALEKLSISDTAAHNIDSSAPTEDSNTTVMETR